MAMDITSNRPPDRSKINLANESEAKQWARQLGVDRNTLAKAVEKVGDSAAAVRKELADAARRGLV